MKYVTHTRTILADVYTPVGAYMRLRDLYPQSALMESSDYHDANNSRSFIGICPMASIAIGHGLCTMTLPDSSTTQTVQEIAYSLGFTSQAYFSRFFRKQHDMSPTEYRNRKQS